VIRAEIDRIAESIDFNGIKLFDGGSGTVSSANSLYNEYGARYGINEYNVGFKQYISVASDIAGVALKFTADASGSGGENSFWDASGKILTVNLKTLLPRVS